MLNKLELSTPQPTKIKPIHPGTILKNHFLTPQKISQVKLAHQLKVSFRRVNEICQGKRGISPDTALRLALAFNLGAEGVEFWMNLQQRYERESWKDYLTQQEKLIRKEVQSFK